MPTITFQNDSVIEEDDLDLSVLDIALKHGIPHVHTCGGEARCSTCRIIIQDGIEHVLPRNLLEQRLADKKGLDNRIRLACQTKIQGPVTLRRLVLDDQDIHLTTYQQRNLSGQERQLAILFSDIRGFTSFSERHLPHDVVHVLNRYFQEMGEAVLKHEGYIDKYMGDGLMALFGISETAPVTNCLNAVSAAIEMTQSLAKINLYLKQVFDETFEIGIGINFGRVVLGNIGHRDNTQLTAIGDAVNVASRIEKETKDHNAPILISECLYNQIKGHISIGKTVRTKLTGKNNEILLYEIPV